MKREFKYVENFRKIKSMLKRVYKFYETDCKNNLIVGLYFIVVLLVVSLIESVYFMTDHVIDHVTIKFLTTSLLNQSSNLSKLLATSSTNQ